MLYLPWRNETVDLSDKYDSAEKQFEACRQKISSVVEKYEHFSLEIDEAI